MWYKLVRIKKENKAKKWLKILAIAGAVTAAFAALAVIYKKFNNACPCCDADSLCCCDDEDEEAIEEATEEKPEEAPEYKEEDEFFQKDEM